VNNTPDFHHGGQDLAPAKGNPQIKFYFESVPTMNTFCKEYYKIFSKNYDFGWVSKVSLIESHSSEVLSSILTLTLSGHGVPKKPKLK